MRGAILTCSALLMLSASALAADGQRITVRGCTSMGPECMFVNSPSGNFALFMSPPRPAPRRGVTVTGTISDGPSFCFARGIKVERWRYNRMRCAAY